MSDHEKLNPNHESIRGLLRVLGPIVFGVGLIFTAAGLISFFSAFGGGGMPRYFWCCFVGMPLMGVGGTMTKAGYLGLIGRYFSAEASPVAKDTFNYLASGTKSGVREMASAVGEGLRGEQQAGVACVSCGAENNTGSKFCNQCGAAIVTERVCASCHTTNDADARFCDECGAALV